MSRCQFAVIVLFIFFSSFVESMTLLEIKQAAVKRDLPITLFRDIEKYAGLDAVEIFEGEFALYRIYKNNIELPKVQFEKKPHTWVPVEWASFYNELFHAWWDLVFEEESIYQEIYSSLKEQYYDKYNKAFPSNPMVALEEAYSETASSVILLKANKVKTLSYKINYTVASVGHSDRPGYTPEAEKIYPSRLEYSYLFKWVTGEVLDSSKK